MAESSRPTPRGCLGRALALAGLAWIGLALFGGIVSTIDDGFDPELIGGLGVLIVPALVAIAGGRAIRRRANRRVEELEVPSARTTAAQRSQQTTQPARPRPEQRRSAPPPPRLEPVTKKDEAVANDLLEGLEKLKTGESAIGQASPKTSQEMIEEARRRWGSG